MKRPQTIEEKIALRFVEVMADFTGLNKKFRYKKAFGEAIGMRQQTLVKVERGANVQYEYLAKLNELFGLNLNWIVTGRGEKYLPISRHRQNGQLSLEERVNRLEKAVKVR